MTVCATQAEVDAAAARGDLIVIDSTWRDSSSAMLWGSSRAMLWDSSSAVLRDSSSAVLRDSSSAMLWDSSRAMLWDSSRAMLRDSSSAMLRDSSSAMLRDSSSAMLWDSSSAMLWDSSRAELRDSSRAELRGSSSAELRGSSSAELRGSLSTARIIGHHASAEGIGRSLRVTDPDTYCQYQGLEIVDGKVLLFKAVDAAGTGGGGYGLTYELGVESVAPDWDPSERECGSGLHLCPSIDQALRYGHGTVRVLACEVAVEDVAVFESNLDKVRVRACTPVEVVWEAEPVTAVAS